MNDPNRPDERHGPPQDGRRLVELERAAALRLLASVPLGRVVFTHKALPAVRPVNHLVDDGHIIIRTHAGAGILSAAASSVVVAYEVDQIDNERRLGWSVIVTGPAHLVRDAAAAERYGRLLRSWVDEPRADLFLRIRIDLISAFELVPARDAVTARDPVPG